jgi:hypothetical protein
MVTVNQKILTLTNHQESRPVLELEKFTDTIELELRDDIAQTIRFSLSKEQAKDLAQFVALWVVSNPP